MKNCGAACDWWARNLHNKQGSAEAKTSAPNPNFVE